MRIPYLFTTIAIPMVRMATTTSKMNITGTSTPIKTFLLLSLLSLLSSLPVLLPLLGLVGPAVT